MSIRSVPSNRDLFLPFLLPYLAYVGLGTVPLPVEWSYGLRLVVVPALLAWGWRLYPSLIGPKSPLVSIGLGLAAGVTGAALWIALYLPFCAPWAVPAWGSAAFGLRLAAAALVVPVFEEFLTRGYFLRVVFQWDQARREEAKEALIVALDDRSLLDVEPGAWSPWAVAISTLAFTIGHTVPEWPAAVVYGLLMAGLWALRGDLLSCIVAHGISNLTLALYVWVTGQWALW